MNEALFDDLKQFIAATVSQVLADVVTKADLVRMNLATKADIQRLDQKIDDLDLKMDTIAATFNDKHNNHETRITKLEQQPA